MVPKMIKIDVSMDEAENIKRLLENECPGNKVTIK